MSAYWIWWIAAALLVGAELLTGTFYLLVVGVGVACGGVAAVLGAPQPLQWMIAGILGVIGTVWLQRWKRNIGAHMPPQQALDIGAQVRVLSWGPDRTARVAYRGTTWDAELATQDTLQSETMYIEAMRGSVLILGERRPAT